MTVDRGVIEHQLREIGAGSRWWEQREMRDLPSALHPAERILAISRGRLGRGVPARRMWLVLVTDQRLLCMRSGRGGGWRQVEMAASQIERTSLRVGPLRMRLLVAGGGEKVRLLLPRDEAYALSRALSTIASPSREIGLGFRPTLMLRRVFNHMLDLPAVAFDPGARPGHALVQPRSGADADERVHGLEHEVDELREQVRFLEQLLQERSERQEAELTRAQR